MKIAGSSASFARSFAASSLTQLEWLDACANELELDGVVFDVAHFPREDAEYLAQLKKLAADLGLTVAALAAGSALGANAERALALAQQLGAPLVIVAAPQGTEDARAWSDFTRDIKAAAEAAKRANVTLALGNAPGTLCAAGADLERLAKDVDSAWLRYALAPAHLNRTDVAPALLRKTVIARHTPAALDAFAGPDDATARALVDRLGRFRGFVVLDADVAPGSDAYQRAVGRFTALRAAHVFMESDRTAVCMPG